MNICFNFNDYSEEQWLPITGYEGLYEVSSNGRVKSLNRLIDYKDCNTIRVHKGKLIKRYINTHGYIQYYLRNNKKGNKHMSEHRLVAIAFIPNPEHKLYVNHKNGIKTDNRVKNLEWCTSSENNKHAYDTGLKSVKLGTEWHRSKLTEEEVLTIFNGENSNSELGKRYNISVATISNIKNKKVWKHLTKDL